MIGQVLQRMRERAGLSVSELANKMRRDSRDIIAREVGKCSPSYLEMEQWSIACGYMPDALETAITKWCED
jgi:ribosome-binding protein aMBF1 (putative translation factor)